MQERQQSVKGKRIGIFGGTFNPPHLGHLLIAEQVYREFGLDIVWLLPVGSPPHKKTWIASRKDREAMAGLIAAERDFLSLCTMELRRKGYTYTVETLRAFKKKTGPQDTLFYIIGSDTLFQLEHWKGFREVIGYTEFICVRRPGTDRQKLMEMIAHFQKEYGKSILLSEFIGPDISSTHIRSALRAGLPIDGMVPQSLRLYLEGHHVYSL